MRDRRWRYIFAIVAAAVAIAAWAGVFAAWLLLEPTLAQWTAIVAAAAVATEAALYVGAVLLGITAFRRLRAKVGIFRTRQRQNGGRRRP